MKTKNRTFYRVEWKHNGQWRMEYSPKGEFQTQQLAEAELRKPEWDGMETRIVEVRP